MRLDLLASALLHQGAPYQLQSDLSFDGQSQFPQTARVIYRESPESVHELRPNMYSSWQRTQPAGCNPSADEKAHYGGGELRRSGWLQPVKYRHATSALEKD